MILSKFRKQFVLTSLRNKELTNDFKEWNIQTIGGFNLYSHPDLQTTKVKKESFEVYLLGFILDWQNPKADNFSILNNLLKDSINANSLIENTFEFFGQFILIIKDDSNLHLINDAAGTKSIFYNSDFSCVASTPKLLSYFVDVKLDKSKAALEFYSSKNFLNKKKKYYIGNSTQYSNVKILLANHKLNINDQSVYRYFPNKVLKGISKEEAAKEINLRLDGHMKALINRFDCEMHVSAGLDSRVLIGFGIKYNIPFVNYCAKPKYDSNYYDTSIPKRILKDYKRVLEVIEYNMDASVEESKTAILNASVDFARTSTTVQNYIFNVLGSRKEKMIINGHGGEFARRSLGVFRLPLKVEDLSQIAGYRNYSYAENIYKKWLNYAKPLVEKYNYKLLENFYWEQFFSIWSSKGVCERNLVSDFYAFFNSRKIFELMLSTPIEDRDPVSHKLFIELISQQDKRLLNYPFNPNSKNRAKIVRSKLGVENVWNEVKFRLRKYK